MSTDKPEKHNVVKQQLAKPESDVKVKALMIFRKKNGLCYKCGEQWGHNHKCPQHTSLHVVEELFDAPQHADEPNLVDMPKSLIWWAVTKRLSQKLLWQWLAPQLSFQQPGAL